MNSQFSIYTSPPSLIPIAPAVILPFKLMNLELIIEVLEPLTYNAGEYEEVVFAKVEFSM